MQHMTDRLAALGGTITVDSRPGAGTTVAGSIPLTADGPEFFLLRQRPRLIFGCAAVTR